MRVPGLWPEGPSNQPKMVAVQSTPLYSFGTRIAANPQLLGGLLPNVATRGLAFMAALRTALAARR